MNTTLPRLDVDNPAAERLRLLDKDAQWKLFGPYLSDRQWGTVREDYSPDGEAWSWFPHDDARSRAYRWGEDGLLGYCDDKQLLNFSLSMWNGKDPILKSRLWGLTNDEGVHGEDVKEVYYFEDATPSGSYLRGMYRYPCDEFPYNDIVKENRRRRHALYETGKYFPEYELIDTGIFDDNRFFDVSVEYFKNSPLDTFIAITIENASDSTETLTLLPTLCFRNTWSWSEDAVKPNISVARDLGDGQNTSAISCDATGALPPMTLFCENNSGSILFCDNETDFSIFEGRSICRSLYRKPPTSNFPKNGVDKHIVHGDSDAVNPAQKGSKAAIKYVVELQPHSATTLRLRLVPTSEARTQSSSPFQFFDEVLRKRKLEADEFYAWVSPNKMSDDRRSIQRQAYAGMLWSQMTYIYNVKEWLSVGPQSRRSKSSRNRDWIHFNAEDVISACDGWEYPWFAAWDAAFHNVVFASIDPDFAKGQVLLLMGQNYVSSNGQVPAYEWDLEDSNPPLQAWSAYKVFSIEREMYGVEDLSFLKHCMPRLNRFYTWFVTSTEVEGRITGRSFLGLDNVSIVDRSKLPDSVETLFQADGTAWAAAAALTMMKISLELKEESSEIFASQFFIDASFRAMALNNYHGDLERPGRPRANLYSMEDGFFYDVVMLKNDSKPRSLGMPTMVGLIPVTAVETIDMNFHEDRPGFYSSIREYFRSRHHSSLGSRITSDNLLQIEESSSSREVKGKSQVGVHAITKDQLLRILRRVLDSNGFLSEFGIRSASKELEHSPFRFDAGEGKKEFRYLPAESYGDGKMFGGNSSWRGSIWMPTTYLLIESLIKYHSILGDNLEIECPTGSGNIMNLRQVAFLIVERIAALFEKDINGDRPSLQKFDRYRGHAKWKRPLFFEYFDGDTGAGIGASHQTGWTGLIADLLTRLSLEQDK